ncbi:hypothetical protein ACI78V_05440 [Geodermatophilus sp. SYSU D00742]
MTAIAVVAATPAAVLPGATTPSGERTLLYIACASRAHSLRSTALG